MRHVTLLLICLGAALAACAQPDPAHPQPDAKDVTAKRQAQIAQWITRTLLTERTLMVQSPTAVYVYRNGILAKYDAKTLTAQGTIDLLANDQENMPAALADKRMKAADNNAKLQQLKRMVPAAIILRDTDLLLVCGETYARIGLEPFKLLAGASLAPPDDAGGDPIKQLTRAVERLTTVGIEPVLSVREGTLYAARGLTLAAINIEDGKVLALVNLPPEMRPQADMAAGGKAARAGKNAPANPPRDASVVGIVARHNENGNLYWTIKDDKGLEYVLTGKPLLALMGTDNILGARVRINGTATDRADDDPQFAAGDLEITDFQVLGK